MNNKIYHRNDLYDKSRLKKGSHHGPLEHVGVVGVVPTDQPVTPTRRTATTMGTEEDDTAAATGAPRNNTTVVKKDFVVQVMEDGENDDDASSISTTASVGKRDDGGMKTKTTTRNKAGSRREGTTRHPSSSKRNSPARGRQQTASPSSLPKGMSRSDHKRKALKLKVAAGGDIAKNEDHGNNPSLPTASGHKEQTGSDDTTGGGPSRYQPRRRSLSPAVKIPEIFTKGKAAPTPTGAATPSVSQNYAIPPAFRRTPIKPSVGASGVDPPPVATVGMGEDGTAVEMLSALPPPDPTNPSADHDGMQPRARDPIGRRPPGPTKVSKSSDSQTQPIGGKSGTSGNEPNKPRRRSTSPTLRIPEVFTRGGVPSSSTSSSSHNRTGTRRIPVVTSTAGGTSATPAGSAAAHTTDTVNEGTGRPSRHNSLSPTRTGGLVGSKQQWNPQHIIVDRVPGAPTGPPTCNVGGDTDSIVGRIDDDHTDPGGGGGGGRSVSSRIQMFEGSGGSGAHVEGIPKTPTGGGPDSLRYVTVTPTGERIGPSQVGTSANESTWGGDGSNSKHRVRTFPIPGAPLTPGSTSGCSVPVPVEGESRRGGPLRRGKRPGGLYNWIQKGNNNVPAGRGDDNDDATDEQSSAFSNDKPRGGPIHVKTNRSGAGAVAPAATAADRSGRSLRSRSVETLTDDDFDENDTIDDDDYHDRRSGPLSFDDGLTSEDGIAGKGDPEWFQKRLTRAHERAQQWQSRYKEERSQWQSAQMELERIKKERDRLLQDQAEQRKVLSDSQQDAKAHEEELAKIQKALEWTSTCMASGSTTEGAKNALDLQSRIESLVQENRQLQAEREHLMQQQVVSKEQVKRKTFFSSDSDAEISLPKTLLKFLHSIGQLQREVIRQVDLASVNHNDGNDNEAGTATMPPPSLQKTSQWMECEASFKEILQASQHSMAIEMGIEGIYQQYQEQIQAVMKQEMTYNYNRQESIRIHASEVASLEAQLEQWKAINAQDGQEAAQQIEEIRLTMEQVRAKYNDSQLENQHLILEHEEHVQSLQAQIENWKKRNADDSAAAAKQMEQLFDNLRDRDSQIGVLQNENTKLETIRVEYEQQLASMSQIVDSMQTNEKQNTEKSEEELQSLRWSLSNQESELQQLRGDLKSRTLELEDLLKQEREEFAAKERDLLIKYEEMQKEHMKATEEGLDEMVNLKTMLSESISDYEETIAQLQDENESIKAGSSKLDVDNKMLLLKCEKLEVDVVSLENSLSTAQKTIEEKTAANAEVLLTLGNQSALETDEKSALVDKLRSELNEMHTMHIEIQRDTEAISSERVDLLALVEVKETKIADLERKFEQAMTNLGESEKNLRDTVNMEKQRTNSLSNKLHSASERVEAMMKELASAEVQLDESLDKTHQLQATVDNLQSELTCALKNNAKCEEERIFSLARMDAQHNAQLDDLHKKLEKLDALESELETSRCHVRKLCEEMQGSTGSLNVPYLKAEDQDSGSEIDIEKTVAAWIENFRANAIQKKYAEEKNEEYHNEVKGLQRQLEERAAEYKEKLAAMDDENRRIKEENERHRLEIECMEKAMMKNSKHRSSPMSSIENLDSSQESLNENDWSEVNKVVESLKAQSSTDFPEKKNMEDVKQTPLQVNNAQNSNIAILERKCEELKTSTERRDAMFRDVIRRQKISMDSLYEDLTLSREQIAKLGVLLSELEGVDPKHDRGSQIISKFHLIDSAQNIESKKKRRMELMAITQSHNILGSKKQLRATLEGRHLSTNRSMMGGVTGTEQSDILQSLMEKKSAKPATSSWRFFGSVKKTEDNSSSEGDLKAIKEENNALKSRLVKLQSQHKEAMYKHKKIVKELELANEAILLRNMALAEQHTYENPVQQ